MLDRDRIAGPSRQRQRIMALRAATPGAVPFVFFPDLGGNVLYARKLAVALPAGAASHALPLSAEALSDLDGVTIPRLCEDMARDLLERWPDEPVHLIGFSFAGFLAFETARCFEKIGGRVAHVWLLDSNGTRAGTGNLLRDPVREVKATIRYLCTLFLKWHHPERFRDVLFSNRMITLDLVGRPEATKRIIRALYRAMLRHRLRPWAGARVTLFRVDMPSETLHLPDDLGWRRLTAGTVKIRRVPGGHLDFLERPDSLDRIAEAVGQALCGGRPVNDNA